MHAAPEVLILQGCYEGEVPGALDRIRETGDLGYWELKGVVGKKDKGLERAALTGSTVLRFVGGGRKEHSRSLELGANRV